MDLQDKKGLGGGRDVWVFWSYLVVQRVQEKCMFEIGQRRGIFSCRLETDGVLIDLATVFNVRW